MASIVIRKLDEAVKAQLKERARRQRRSLEAEVRAILEQAAADDRVVVATEKGFGTLTAEVFAEHGLTEAERATIDDLSRSRRAQFRSKFPKT